MFNVQSQDMLVLFFCEGFQFVLGSKSQMKFSGKSFILSLKIWSNISFVPQWMCSSNLLLCLQPQTNYNNRISEGYNPSTLSKIVMFEHWPRAWIGA